MSQSVDIQSVDIPMGSDLAKRQAWPSSSAVVQDDPAPARAAVRCILLSGLYDKATCSGKQQQYCRSEQAWVISECTTQGIQRRSVAVPARWSPVGRCGQPLEPRDTPALYMPSRLLMLARQPAEWKLSSGPEAAAAGEAAACSAAARLSCSCRRVWRSAGLPQAVCCCCAGAGDSIAAVDVAVVVVGTRLPTSGISTSWRPAGKHISQQKCIVSNLIFVI